MESIFSTVQVGPSNNLPSDARQKPARDFHRCSPFCLIHLITSIQHYVCQPRLHQRSTQQLLPRHRHVHASRPWLPIHSWLALHSLPDVQKHLPYWTMVGMYQLRPLALDRVLILVFLLQEMNHDASGLRLRDDGDGERKREGESRKRPRPRSCFLPCRVDV